MERAGGGDGHGYRVKWVTDTCREGGSREGDQLQPY